MKGSKFPGYAKPDDPIYKEGWSVWVGPLLGTQTDAAATPKPSEEDPKRKKRGAKAKKGKNGGGR